MGPLLQTKGSAFRAIAQKIRKRNPHNTLEASSSFPPLTVASLPVTTTHRRHQSYRTYVRPAFPNFRALAVDPHLFFIFCLFSCYHSIRCRCHGCQHLVLLLSICLCVLCFAFAVLRLAVCLCSSSVLRYCAFLLSLTWLTPPSVQKFFRCLDICHTVLPEDEEFPEKIKYEAASPDGSALEHRFKSGSDSPMKKRFL
ncbi:hypothetical protein PIB30_022835 [Stylosanthes scabra]|uniref:Uncharacterized protein n=1 Tax=Stylosanthes scabra TaxID=79078 RepID=A0ABU6W8S3_9FABA|nr:hypothetical protein [Stylosanthes scabra]